MKFTFTTSEEADQGVVLFNMSNLYRVPGMQNRFLLKEFTPVRQLPQQTTIIPQVKKTLDYAFITELAEEEFNVPTFRTGHEKLFAHFDEYFESTHGVSAREIQKAETAWKKVESGFINVLNQLFDDVESKVEKVTVYVTRYGHAGSYYYRKNEKSIAIYWNIGAPLITVAYLVIQALVHLSNYQKWLHKEPAFVKSGLWHHKISMATILSNLPMMTNLFRVKINSDWLHEDVVQSPEMIRKLCLADTSCSIDFSNPMRINGIPIGGLTKSEDVLLRTLAENRGEYVTQDVIAKSLWHENASEKFSVYYFPKLVFTLRKKLAAAGINPRLIRSQSGAGYYIE